MQTTEYASTELEVEYPLVARALAAALIVLLVVLPVGRVYADEVSKPTPEPVPEVTVGEPEVVPEESVTEPEPEILPEPEPEEVVPEIIDPIASTTEEVVPDPEPEPEVVVEPEPQVDEISPVTPYVDFRARSDSEYVFNRSDCVNKGGVFYCVRTDADTEPAASTARAAEVFADKDGDGDYEIFVREDGAVKRITDNTYDDVEPVLDQATGRIAWHANVKDRYQIFVFDPRAGTHQLTRGEYNSQHPSIDGDSVVFQSWTDENWEVYRADLSGGFENIPVTRLSGSGGHDMFPKVFETFVTWQAREGEAWRSKSLNLVTGEFSDLGEGTGGDVESTRLVLLVERRTESGDVVRMGYDVDTGAEIALSTKPVEPLEPETLPSPYEEPAAVPPVQTSTTTPQRDESLPVEPEPEPEVTA